jgi:glycosyltransferase involved in cell wall biosynthesis
MHVAIVGTYPPTRCGIATFTADLESALIANGVEVSVIEVDASADQPHQHSTRVSRDDLVSYRRAGNALNELGCDVVLIEHEFGIFGGVAGEYILELVAELEIPYAVTLHTVLPEFSDEESKVIQTLGDRAAVVTVFTETARRLLQEQDLVASHLIRVVPHGAPAELYGSLDSSRANERYGIPLGAPMMSTFGLLSAGKGLELAIEALALLADDHPDLRYVIAGGTHPEVVKRDGEHYRNGLAALAKQLGVADRVIFVNRFLSLEELAELLAASDLVCTPYRGENQSVSGVLTFALAAGCPIVSTPYRYARDLLADGAGLLVDFDDTQQFANSIKRLLDPARGATARAAARTVSAQMPWLTVGKTIRDLLSAIADRRLVSDGYAVV